MRMRNVSATTANVCKWCTQVMDKINADFNLTAGLKAVPEVAVGAHIMLRRNSSTSRLVNGVVGTVIAIKTHHITVQFDGRAEPYAVERVKSRFMVLKKLYVHCKQFPPILAFALTVHKCQCLSLDCGNIDPSDGVFCASMAYD